MFRGIFFFHIDWPIKESCFNRFVVDVDKWWTVCAFFVLIFDSWSYGNSYSRPDHDGEVAHESTEMWRLQWFQGELIYMSMQKKKHNKQTHIPPLSNS